MNEESKNYEIGFLVRVEQDREELVKILKSCRLSVINDGEFLRMKLAYPIMRENFAYFGYLYFSGDPESIKELKNELKTSPKILRHLIVSQPIMVKKIESKIVFEKAYVPVYTEDAKSLADKLAARPALAQTPKTAPKTLASPEPASFAEVATKAESAKRGEVLSNEELEKKLEEILK